MKKLVMISLLFVLAIQTYAQQTKFGIYIEPAPTWYSTVSRDVTNSGAMMGFSGGLMIDYFFQDNYAFSSGIGIGMHKGKLSYDEQFTMNVYDEVLQIDPCDVKYQINYIHIPLGLKLKTNEIGYFTYFANVGLSTYFNHSAKASTSLPVTFGDGETRHLEDDNIKEEVEFASLGYHFGAGLEYGLGGNTSLIFGVTFHNIFTDVTAESTKVTPRILSIRAGIMF
ncbi:MAG: PorT family protein [Bacteroidales bacterium]|nr:PorT family protein [Bacteroidales bacterium]